MQSGSQQLDRAYEQALQAKLAACSHDEADALYEEALSHEPVVLNGCIELRKVRGNDRKLAGAFYTPKGLIDLMLDTVLEPLLETRASSLEELLGLAVIDPSCGSGRFLEGAGERILDRARRIDPSITFQAVASACLYGADTDPVALALCKARLHHPPESHLRCGDSLLADLKSEFAKPQGFDLVIGNPPWEHTELKEKEWIARHCPELGTALTGHERKQALARLAVANPELFAQLEADRARYAAFGAEVARMSGLRQQRARLNTYVLFAKLGMQLLSEDGMLGMFVPTGIAVDSGNADFFAGLLESNRLRALYDFENRRRYFPGVDSRFRFSLLACSGAPRPEAPVFVFLAQDVSDVLRAERRIELSGADLALFNPRSRTAPVLRTVSDYSLCRRIYREVPVFADSGWRYTLRQGLFNMTSRSHLFLPYRDAPELLPLYEAKYTHFFNHRWATCESGKVRLSTDVELSDARYMPAFRFAVAREEVDRLLPDDVSFQLCYRGISNPTNERTFIPSIIPRSGIGNSLSLIQLAADQRALQVCLCANLSSLVFDYLFRQKMSGTNVNFFLLDQAPVLPPDRFADQCPWSRGESLSSYIETRALRLLSPLGLSGNLPPLFSDERRQVQAELDAAFMHLYGVTESEIELIIDSFPVLRRREEAQCGVFGTREIVRSVYCSLTRGARAASPEPV